MVLKQVFLFIFFFLGVVSQKSEGPMLQHYKTKINKQVNSNFDFSKGMIELAKINSTKSDTEIYEVYHQNDLMGYVYLKGVKACSLNGCLANKAQANAVIGSEYYDLSIVVNRDKSIQSIKVLNYFSDYGYEISSKSYLRKYSDRNICDFANGNSAVDGISGATISYNALLGSLGEFCSALEL